MPVFLDEGTFVFCIYGIDDDKALKGLWYSGDWLAYYIDKCISLKCIEIHEERPKLHEVHRDRLNQIRSKTFHSKIPLQGWFTIDQLLIMLVKNCRHHASTRKQYNQVLRCIAIVNAIGQCPLLMHSVHCTPIYLDYFNCILHDR